MLLKYSLLVWLYVSVSIIKWPQTIEYPFPVKYLGLQIENENVQMAYMDVKPSSPNGKTVILFHGKNFNGFYWKDVISFLSQTGYRVIVPDQIGWGKSSKPDIHYSFYMLAKNNQLLLDSLRIKKIVVIGHSMGGMLATRFALMFPDRVEKLVLENPIGLEDYRKIVPYKSLEELYNKEMNATYESIKKYQQSYYPAWKSDYEKYVAVQAEALKDPGYKKIAWVNALTYEMIYEQPVCYEFEKVKVPTLLIIGQSDRTVVGKDNLPKEKQGLYGDYPILGRKTKSLIPNSSLIELTGIGHIPHVQDKELFQKHLMKFLSQD
jgi:pimeloyl-ACP methyl ester carboxylesterase